MSMFHAHFLLLPATIALFGCPRGSSTVDGDSDIDELVAQPRGNDNGQLEHDEWLDLMNYDY